MQFTLILTFAVCILCIPTIANSSQGGRTVTAKSESDLHSILATALPGDTIELLPINYSGDFTLPDKGSSDVITLRGAYSNGKSTTILGSKIALDILGGLWSLKNLAIGSGQQGVVVKGSKHLLKSLSIAGVDQGVILMGDSNKLESLSIKKGDQGVIVRGNNNELVYTSCTGQKSVAVNVESGNGTDIRSLTVSAAQKFALIVGKGTCCGNMESLSLAGLLEIRGRENEFRSLSSSGAVNVLGCENYFSSASVQQMFVTKECQNSLDNYNFIQEYLSKPYEV